MNIKSKLVLEYFRWYNFFCGLLSYLKIRGIGKLGISSNIHYKSLYYISFFSKKKFVGLKSEVMRINEQALKEKSKCKVGIIIYTTSMWSIEGLYRLLDDDPKYEPTIIVVPFSDSTESTYQETKQYFETNGYRLKAYNDVDFNLHFYDLYLYTNPYISTDIYANLLELQLNKLVAYVSYSYMLSDNIEKLNIPIYYLSWKFFCDSEFYKNVVETQSRINTSNMVFCGYPKMDGYYKCKTDKQVLNHKKKVIIYAPHQSVNRNIVRYATFEKNGWYLLYLAEKYKDRLFWIVKPHPLLRSHSVEAGIFQDEKGYDDYLERWLETNAALVIENGDYFNLFHDSDAMITDSVSFLAEYQFTGKPLLMLDSGKQKLNAFGESIRDILYKSKGNDYGKIEEFILNVLDEKDPKAEERQYFFQKYLSYTDGKQNFACDNIYRLFKNELQ